MYKWVFSCHWPPKHNYKEIITGYIYALWFYINKAKGTIPLADKSRDGGTGEIQALELKSLGLNIFTKTQMKNP